MPMYWGDYLADTAHFTTTEHGAYLLLIGYYWTNGGLPQDENAIRRIAKLSPLLWRKISPLLKQKFDALWRHKRIDMELAKAIEKSKAQSAKALLRHSRGTADAYAGSMPSESQSQSESKKERDPASKKERDPAADAAGACPTPSGDEASPNIGERGHKRETRRAAPAAGFAEFWLAYPRKVSKGAAVRAYERALRKTSADVILAALKAQVPTWDMSEPKYIKHPSTWLHQECWSDEITTPVRKENKWAAIV
jgi:uncharacterized protein YdaU (DUF1376 family)